VRPREPLPTTPSTKRYDLVLLHGLTNKNPWGQDFLAALSDLWGPGRVFLVYTNRHAKDRAAISTRHVRGRRLIVGGRDLKSAGDDSVVRQAQHLHEVISHLQAERGLGAHFSILAHSMGGLVARRYVADHPGVVTGLVTLGSPHHGSPLANDFKWVGLFLHARDAIEDLKPERCAAFNAEHPAADAPLAEGGRMFTIRGDADGADAFGSMGELLLGSMLLRTVYHVDNDGIVPNDSALLDGATHLADFPDHDHYDLIRDPAVARRAAEALP